MAAFTSADILIPKTNLEKWAVIACDQFTSQPEYWEEVKKTAGEEPSAFHIILPEAELKADNTERAEKINAQMRAYLKEDLFREYKNSFIYVERTLMDGSIRTGVVGCIDLDAYDYSDDAGTAIRATERTVLERIPPRKQVRSGAVLDLPHILLLCDDAQHMLVESLTAIKDQLPVVYDFDLMMQGGHITGRLVEGEQARAFEESLEQYTKAMEEQCAATGRSPMIFAMGDGNHSLASAKACRMAELAEHPGEDRSASPLRFALAELGNIHEESLHFEAIHRVVTNTDPKALLQRMQEKVGAAEGYPLHWVTENESGTVYLSREKGSMAVSVLQEFLDEELAGIGGSVDYIHDEDAVNALGKKPGCIGLLLPAMEKKDLFPAIVAGGVLPRKTFSMGHAREKRYYLEARKLEEN
ncbi:MAG: DUF1015 domain-containing protein [Oscillospiraceae bacterium]|nr:DUF1015 domain-containing protein [Oscillospiraceae bacterium]